MFKQFFITENFIAKAMLLSVASASALTLVFQSTFGLTLYMLYGAMFASCISHNRGIAGFGIFCLCMCAAATSLVSSAVIAAFVPDISQESGTAVVDYFSAISFGMIGSVALRRAYLQIDTARRLIK